MAKKKCYSKSEDYLCLITGKISKIIELNTEYENRFKTVFSLDIPRVEDKRFDTCISWERQIINVGDLVCIKGRYLESAFLVKKLVKLREGQDSLYNNKVLNIDNGNLQDTT